MCLTLNLSLGNNKYTKLTSNRWSHFIALPVPLKCNLSFPPFTITSNDLSYVNPIHLNKQWSSLKYPPYALETMANHKPPLETMVYLRCPPSTTRNNVLPHAQQSTTGSNNLPHPLKKKWSL